MISLGRGRDIAKVLRPWSGIPIFLATWGWWYPVVWRLVPTAAQTLEGETLQRLFSFERQRYRRYADPYYLYRTAGLALPWVTLYALALATPMIKQFKQLKHRPQITALWWMVFIPLAALHLSLGRRWYYMLPALPLLLTLMARTGVELGRILLLNNRRTLWTALVLLHVIGLAVAAVAFRQIEPAVTRPPMLAALLTVAIAIVAGTVVLMRPAEQERRVHRDLTLTAIVALVFFAAVELNGSLWESGRWARRQFSRDVGRHVTPNAVLLGWQSDWELEQYYNHRVIPTFKSGKELTDELHNAPAAFILVKQPASLNLAPQFQSELILQADHNGRGRLELWRVTRSNAPR
jgi:4-amino-4-deoxy-L-arabinose transferase-like glycosyltransferase